MKGFLFARLARIRACLRNLFGRERVDRDLDRELNTHLDLLVEQKIANGMSPQEARRAARLEFGDVAYVEDYVRDVRVGVRGERVGQCLGHGVRFVAGAPGFAAGAVLVLGLGIGVNTAMFTLIDGSVLRALPVEQPDRLARLYRGGGSQRGWSHPVWREIRRGAGRFDGALSWSHDMFDLAGVGQSRFVSGIWVSGGFFDVLGVPAVRGRVLTDADDRRGCGAAGPVAVISHRLWRGRFEGAPDVVGRSVPLDGVPFTVVGVTPPEFFGPTVGRAFDVAVPHGCEPLLRGRRSALDNRWAAGLRIMVRLRPEQSLAAGTAAVRALQPSIRDATMPDFVNAASREGYLREPLLLLPAGTPAASATWGRYGTSMLVLMALAGLALVIMCANVATVLLARGVARRREFSLRAALGATPGRIARQVLAEGVILSAGGGALGVLVGQWITGLIVRGLSTWSDVVFLDVSRDWRVVGFVVAVSAAAAVLFGAAPAWRAARAEPRTALAGRGPCAAAGRLGLDRGIIVVQVALALVVVVTAGLLVRTWTALVDRDVGFDRERVLLATPHGFRQRYPDDADRLRLYTRIRESVGEVAGVEAVAVSFPTPASGDHWTVTLDSGDAPGLPASGREVDVGVVSPGWFATYGVPLLRGRDFADADVAAPPLAIVNDAFVRRFLPGGSDPIGRTITLPLGPEKFGRNHRRIIGVAGDATYSTLRDPLRPTAYLFLGQEGMMGLGWGIVRIHRTPGFEFLTVGVRAAAGSPAALTRGVDRAIRDVDAGIRIDVRTLEAQVDGILVEERLTAVVSALFGGLALLLAAVGLYGVTLLALRRQRVEIGIRLALGATRGRVLGGAMLRVGALVGAGIAVGGLAALAVGRSLDTLLYGLQPRDPTTLAVAAGVLALAGVGAGLAAALPAVRMDPSRVLRQG